MTCKSLSNSRSVTVIRRVNDTVLPGLWNKSSFHADGVNIVKLTLPSCGRTGEAQGLMMFSNGIDLHCPPSRSHFSCLIADTKQMLRFLAKYPSFVDVAYCWKINQSGCFIVSAGSDGWSLQKYCHVAPLPPFLRPIYLLLCINILMIHMHPQLKI